MEEEEINFNKLLNFLINNLRALYVSRIQVMGKIKYRKNKAGGIPYLGKNSTTAVRNFFWPLPPDLQKCFGVRGRAALFSPPPSVYPQTIGVRLYNE